MRRIEEPPGLCGTGRQWFRVRGLDSTHKGYNSRKAQARRKPKWYIRPDGAELMTRAFQIPSITPALLWATDDAVIAGLDAIESVERRRTFPTLYGIAAPTRGRSASPALATGIDA